MRADGPCNSYTSKFSVGKDDDEKEPQPPEIEEKITPEDLAEVEQILTATDPGEEIKKHLDNVIAGEKENKGTITLLGASCKLKEKAMVILKGTAGVGKTVLMRIADFFVVRDIGRLTTHALDYLDLKGVEILRLKELGYADDETTGLSTLKFLSSDDQGYTVEATIRDKETGEFTTKTYRIPAITIFTSTTRVSIDPQLERRAWILNPDESEEQTETIRLWKARRANQITDVKLGFRRETDETHSRRILTLLFRRIEPVEVLVPFPNSLFEVLGTKKIRVRGDYDKLQMLLELDALLMQRQLPRFTHNNKTFVLVTPDRTLIVIERARQPLLSMLLELEKRTRDLGEALTAMKLGDEGTEIDRRERERIAKRMKRSERTIRRYLDELENSGYASSDGKKPKTYTLLFNMSEILADEVGLLDNTRLSNVFRTKFAEEAKNWFKNRLDIGQKSEVSNTPVFPQELLSNYFSGLDYAPFTERGAETRTIPICPIADQSPTDPTEPPKEAENPSTEANRTTPECPILPTLNSDTNPVRDIAEHWQEIMDLLLDKRDTDGNVSIEDLGVLTTKLNVDLEEVLRRLKELNIFDPTGEGKYLHYPR